MFELEGVSFSYAGHGLPRPVSALVDVNLAIEPGEFVALAGANASGKSTLALLLAGILKPTSGVVHSGGRPPECVPGRVCVVFQDPENTFVAPTLEEDVAFGPENQGLEAAEIRRLVDVSLGKVGLSGHELRHPATLSGGEKQLAALAGVMACRPEALVLDEATAFLDASHRRLVLDTVRDIHADGMTVVMITQETDEMWLAGRLLVLQDGKLAFDGAPGALLLEPGECRRLGIEPDPLADLAGRLAGAGVKVPSGKPTVDGMEEALVAGS